MSKGITHDKVSYNMIPFVIFLGIIVSDILKTDTMIFCLIIVLFYMLGFLLLSPDLDTRSDAFYRWKIFRFIWIPYQKVIPHRSILSHGILVGTVIRLLYITTFICLITKFVLHLTMLDFINISIEYILSYKNFFIAFFIGIESSSVCHIFTDKISLFIKLLHKASGVLFTIICITFVISIIIGVIFHYYINDYSNPVVEYVYLYANKILELIK